MMVSKQEVCGDNKGTAERLKRKEKNAHKSASMDGDDYTLR